VALRACGFHERTLAAGFGLAAVRFPLRQLVRCQDFRQSAVEHRMELRGRSYLEASLLQGLTLRLLFLRQVQLAKHVAARRALRAALRHTCATTGIRKHRCRAERDDRCYRKCQKLLHYALLLCWFVSLDTKLTWIVRSGVLFLRKNRVQNALGCEWRFHHPHTAGIVNRVCQRGQRSVDSDLGDALRAEGPGWLIGLDENRTDLRRVHRRE